MNAILIILYYITFDNDSNDQGSIGSTFEQLLKWTFELFTKPLVDYRRRINWIVVFQGVGSIHG